MAKITLSKSGLQKEKQQLKLYKKLLPSLDLKRMQLRAEHARAKIEMIDIKQRIEQAINEISEKLPMVSDQDVALSGLVKINSLKIKEKSVVGVKVPFLEEIVFDVLDYSMLSKPQWVDAYIVQIKNIIDLKIRAKLINDSIDRLGHAVRRITQHVNLFEKILIPNAKKNIQKIQIVLGDAERTAVVRSKIAKSLHARQRQAFIALEA